MAASSIGLEEYLEEAADSAPLNTGKLSSLLEEGAFRPKKIRQRPDYGYNHLLYRVEGPGDVYGLLVSVRERRGRTLGVRDYEVIDGEPCMEDIERAEKSLLEEKVPR